MGLNLLNAKDALYSAHTVTYIEYLTAKLHWSLNTDAYMMQQL